METSLKGVKTWLWLTASAFVLAAILAAFSTADFIAHLDRQMHAIHCAFVPSFTTQLGDSGCRAALLSPYSSLFRQMTWGGLPISLLALCVFAYGVYRIMSMLWQQQFSKAETLFVMVMTGFALATSVVFAGLSWFSVGSFCKLCVGIYSLSLIAFVSSIMAHRKAQFAKLSAPYGRFILQGIGFVVLLSTVYLVLKPAMPKTYAGCGTLVKQEDTYGVMLPLGNAKGTPSIAVLDPLCPACKAFDLRLTKSGLSEQLTQHTILFPLDSSCNWMVKESLHKGACIVSEAILCDASLLPWAFEHQQELQTMAQKSETTLRDYLLETYPKLKGCLGSYTVKNKLNRSLRYVVANALPVLTPQLFINGKRLCDEDTDLGLEYTVSSLVKGAKL